MSKLKTSSNPTSEAPRFEDAIRELESLVAQLESGQMALDESLGAYRRGVALLKHCQLQLDDAETQLRILDQDQLKSLALNPEGNA